METALGLPGFDFSATGGWVARSGTPKPIIDKLSAVLAKVVQSPAFAEKAAAAGGEATSSTPQEMAMIIRADLKKFAEAVRVSGAKLQ